jgi:hypothetical protein
VSRERSHDFGGFAVQGLIKGEQLVEARDAVIIRTPGFKNCSRQMMVATYRPTFVYDLKSGERRFKLYKPEHLCASTTSGKEKSAQALRNYFSSLKLEKVLGFPPDTAELDMKRARKLLSNVEHISSNRYEATLTLFAPRIVEFQYVGGKSSDGAFEGYAELRFENKVTCLRGQCHPAEFSRLAGHFVAGILQVRSSDDDRSSAASASPRHRCRDRSPSPAPTGARRLASSSPTASCTVSWRGRAWSCSIRSRALPKYTSLGPSLTTPASSLH